jgi:hypothetical protein
MLHRFKGEDFLKRGDLEGAGCLAGTAITLERKPAMALVSL